MNLIWDFDGTIYNSYPRILNAFYHILNSKYELTIPVDRIEDLVLIDTKHCAKVIAEENQLNFVTLLKEIRLYYDQNGEEDEKIFPEVVNILNANKHRHFLVTHRDRASLTQRLTKSGISGIFELIIAKEDGFKEKPSPDSFRYIIDKFKLNEDDTIAIGDRDIDAGAGRNAGIKAVVISRKNGIVADYQIQNHCELGNVLTDISLRNKECGKARN